jgi:hypothetical protein
MKIQAFTLSLLLSSSALPAENAPSPATRPPFSITPQQKVRLLKALEGPDRQYDPQEKMLKKNFGSPGYHTTLSGGMVHPTRDALGYAVACLDTGEPDRLKRAEEILRRVIDLQDQDPKNRTYGIWSWFLEEPLAKMSPPDWNWADFCGVQLLQVALDHRARLDPDLAKRVDDAIRHAAASIRKRNVGPGYTNIAIMGTYVTLVAAERVGDDDLKAYALERLKRFHDYTLEQGAFTEYNSPTYTVVALSELGRMRLHVRDAGARKMGETLYRMAWEEIARHFHPPTRQWAGPHSRAYSALLGKGTLAFVERSTDGRVPFGAAESAPSLDEHRLPLPCPRDLEPFFTTLDKPRPVVETFIKAENPVVGTTYLHPRFALGTVNRCDTWNQRRDLLAYWGTAEKPGYLHLRLLKNGYDLAAGQFFCAQQEGRALAAIAFATDGGDTHVSLSKLKDGLVKAKDLRLRFELGGEAGKTEPSAPISIAEPARLRFDGLAVDLAVPFTKFGDATGRWEAGHDEKKGVAWIDVVLHAGDERTFKLAELDEAALGIAVQFGDGSGPAPAAKAAIQDGRLSLTWGTMRVEVPVKPGKAGEIVKGAKTAQ